MRTISGELSHALALASAELHRELKQLHRYLGRIARQAARPVRQQARYAEKRRGAGQSVHRRSRGPSPVVRQPLKAAAVARRSASTVAVSRLGRRDTKKRTPAKGTER